MTEKLMIEKSGEILCDFFKSLGEEERKQVGLMGGWAVHYLLKNKNVEHIGSRDIDAFFDPAKTKMAFIEEKLGLLGFKPHSTFRWVRIFHSETEKELSIEESKKYPIHELSYIYFDIATPVEIEHSMPEPILKKVFEKEREMVEVNGLKIMVPAPRALIEMKLKSVIQRTDTFKRAKDIADLYALLNNYNALWATKNGQRVKTKSISKVLINKFKEELGRFKIDGTIAGAATMLNTSQTKIEQLLDKL